ARAAILQTDLTSLITFGFRRSSREEISIIRVYVMDAPKIRIDMTVKARAPKLLSLGTATRTEKTDTVATDWLSKPVRVGTVDSQKIQTFAGTLIPSVEMGLRNLTSNATVYPEPRAGWSGLSSLFARAPKDLKNVHYDLWLPDTPDEPQPPQAQVRGV